MIPLPPLQLFARLCLAGFLPISAPAADDEATPRAIASAVRCEGSYPKHLQGIATDDLGSLYWCFTVELVRTDLDGNVARKVPVADHHGDLCHVDGKLYVAVNLGKFNEPAGQADSWVYVYDAETLEELTRHEVPEVVHGAGGIGHLDGSFLVVGGLPEGFGENDLYEYDESFRFRGRHVLDSGYTLKGIQTATFADDHWWFGCYGNPRVLLKADRDDRLIGRWEFDASLGIEGLGGGRFLVARGLRDDEGGYSGEIYPAEADEGEGLRRVGSDSD